MRRMPDGTTLSDELLRAMKRIEGLGVRYPPGYCETILEKYTLENVPFPYIVMQIAEARIRNHFLYPHLLENPGHFLDYGCGTGDAIRRLIRDGYPAERLTGFDVTDASLCLGYDLYLDRDEMEHRFRVSPTFPFPPGQFDVVYSGNVIHVIREDAELVEYLGNAHGTLKPGGIFFGVTLGLAEGISNRGSEGPPRLMPAQIILRYLADAGFGKIILKNDEISPSRNRPAHLAHYQFSAIAE